LGMMMPSELPILRMMTFIWVLLVLQQGYNMARRTGKEWTAPARGDARSRD